VAWHCDRWIFGGLVLEVHVTPEALIRKHREDAVPVARGATAAVVEGDRGFHMGADGIGNRHLDLVVHLGLFLLLFLLGLLTLNIYLILVFPFLIVLCVPYFLLFTAGLDILRSNPRSRMWILVALPPWVILLAFLFGTQRDFGKEFAEYSPFIYVRGVYNIFLALYFSLPRVREIFREGEDKKSLVIPRVMGMLPLVAFLGFDLYRGQSTEPERSVLFYCSGVHEYRTPQGHLVRVEYKNRKKHGFFREYELGYYDIDKDIQQIRRGTNAMEKRLVLEETYRDGKRDGTSKRHLPSGQ
jgi:hypothetical protein